nr:tail fiber domain-containing protein [uncultured Psychroserpens sp.]
MEARIKFCLFLVFIFPVFAFAQVGINTTNPNASLDIRSSSVSTPANTDGILIPKIDEYPSANPTAAQDGMMVYATGNGSVAKGFYYWDIATITWVSFAGTTIEKIDDLIDGKSDSDGSINGSSIFLGVNAGVNDDETNNRNVGIGFFSMHNNTSGSGNVAYGEQVLYSNSIGSNNTALGANSMYDNTTGFANTVVGNYALRDNIDGDYNTVIGRFAGSNTNGNRNVFIGANSGSGLPDTKEGSVFIGFEAGYNEANSNRLYIENTSSTSPLIYGEFDNDFLKINGDLEITKSTNASTTVVTPFGFQSALKLFERGTGGDYGFEFQYDGAPDKLYLWSRTFAGNEDIRMTWLKDGKIGMNDTSPDARLDIEASNTTSPTNTDGILIPRIDAFPSTNPTANQNGMLVFLNTDNSFYFWNNSTTAWQKMSQIERVNDLLDGKSDNDGSDNGSSLFLGVNAGANDDSTDNDNVGLGYYALHFNTSGERNTALGSTALISNTTGNDNAAFGRRALYWSTTASDNSAFGSLAMEDNTTGTGNSAFGSSVLANNTTGSYNSVYGSFAMFSNTTGGENTSFGYTSLYVNTTGSSNSVFGNYAMYNNTTGSSNSVLGNNAMFANTTGFSNTAIGRFVLNGNTTGYFNTAVGRSALGNITTGRYNTAIGANSGPTIGLLVNTTSIGYGAQPTSSNEVRIGNASVGIIGGYASWTLFSDRRLKTNIQDNVVGLEFIKKLRPVSYNYDMNAIARFDKTPDSLRIRDAEILKAQEIQTGFIAQEVEAAANAVGFDFHGIVKPHDSNGTYALRYAEFVVPLVKAMQEQQSIIETQEQEISELRNEIEQIKLFLKHK